MAKNVTPSLKLLFNQVTASSKYSLKDSVEKENKQVNPIIKTTLPIASAVKLQTLGTSVAAIQARQNVPIVNPYIAEDTNGTNKQGVSKAFTQEDLRMKWLEYCDSLPHERIADAQRMKIMDVQISTFPAIEVKVPNKLMEKHMRGIKSELEHALRKLLLNDYLTISLKIDENTVVGLTDAEIFDVLAKENTAFAQLRKTLHLELT